MIKIGELDKWLPLKPGTSLLLKGADVRTIRIDVNAMGKARLFVTDQENGEERFLTTVIGNDKVEFVMGGNVCISTSDEDVYIYTSELEQTHLHFEGTDIYTRIAERAQRNPELEYILEKQAQNFERRLQSMARSIEDRYSRQYEQAQFVSEGATTPTPDQSEPDGDEKSPVGDNEET